MELTCTKSTKTANAAQPGFINTLVSNPIKVESTIMGVKKTTNTKRTFYVKTDEAIAVNHKENVDLSQYNIRERSFDAVDQQTGEVIKITGSWLHAKVAVE